MKRTLQRKLKSRRLACEHLEQRRVMAAHLQGGFLWITGGNSADHVVVSDTTPQNNMGLLLVDQNGAVSVFPEAGAPAGIKFYGHGGNDTFSTNYGRPLIAFGGDGNDTISGGYGPDTLYGGNGNDTLNGNAGYDTLYGNSGADTLRGGNGIDHIYGQDGDDHCYGDDGNDVVSGNAGEDEVYGGAGNDQQWGGEDDDILHGGDGNDELQSGSGDDTLYGENGNDWMTGQENDDKLFGGNDNDTMFGYTGNDFLDGSNGNDYLSGWTGNDVLFGKEGNDDLFGGAGRDSLFGGNGVDDVNGGSDSDRFLTISDEAEIADPQQADAVIRFNGPKAWTYGEILRVDGGLARLHERTGNTILLKDPQLAYNPADPDKPLMTFRRDITDYKTDPDTGELVPYGNVGTNNENGQITLYDSMFSGSATKVATFTIHEIGHFWDQPAENTMNLSGENVVNYFRSLSDWQELGDGDIGDTMVHNGVTYVKGGNSNSVGTWWYAQGAPFVTDYATTNPHEDYADTFSAIIMGNQYHRNDNDTLSAPVAKRGWLNAWLDAL